MLAIGVAQQEDSSPLPPPSPRSTELAPLPSAPIPELHVVEKKVHTELDNVADRDSTRWILDTGASNHMSESRTAFADLDTGVTGSI